MNNLPDLGSIFVLAFIFWIIFGLLELFLIKIKFPPPFYLLVYALISSWAWYSWPRAKE